jgi:hypothetical protein
MVQNIPRHGFVEKKKERYTNTLRKYTKELGHSREVVVDVMRKDMNKEQEDMIISSKK